MNNIVRTNANMETRGWIDSGRNCRRCLCEHFGGEYAVRNFTAV